MCAATDMYTRGNMTIVFNHTIMIYCRSSIYNAMFTYYSIGINNCSSHYYSSLANFSRRRDNCRRMYCRSKLNSGIVSPQSLHNHLANSVHTYAHNHRRKSHCIMQYGTSATLIHIKVIIHKSLNLDTISIQYIFNHFTVTT